MPVEKIALLAIGTFVGYYFVVHFRKTGAMA